jgi:LCP family protein required for cell wall assembly
MSRTSRHLRWQRLSALAFLIAIGLSLYGAQTSAVAAALGQGQRVPLLLFGVDAADASRHTDTLMLGIFNPVHDFMSVLSIPRDTRLDLPGYRFHRINEIYGYQLRTTKDADVASRKVLEGIDYLLSTSSDAVKIPYYVQVDFAGFRDLIDLLGGVWVTVKQSMNYDDSAGNYHFHREPGRYLMDGDEALHYVRFRGPSGDRGRIFRQQEFVKSLLRRLANPLLVFRVPEICLVIKSAIKTNLSFWDMTYLLVSARRLRSEDIGFYILPGSVSGMYWAPNHEMIGAVSGLLFYGRKTDNAATIVAPEAHVITVKVWNASGHNGAAYELTKFLRKNGYDVLDWGNYDQVQLQTRVVDRTGSIERAQSVAQTLGVDNYHSEPNPKALVDVDVVIGQNYRLTDTPQ